MKRMLMLMLIVVRVASAADISLTWTTLDGGGTQQAAGGDFVMSATAGQGDAGQRSGGGYWLGSGFWPGPFDGPGWLIPTLHMLWYANTPHVCWPADAGDWQLQTAADLRAPAWSGVTNAPSVLGTDWAVPVDPAHAVRFYRLYKP